MSEEERLSKLEALQGAIERLGGMEKFARLDGPDKLSVLKGYGCDIQDLDAVGIKMLGPQYLKTLFERYETFAEFKARGTINLFKEYLGFNERDLLEIWSKQKAKREGSKKENNSAVIFSRRGQAEVYIQENPLWFDNNGDFWKWDHQNYRWDKIDETDLLNGIYKNIGIDTTKTKEIVETLNALKQVARLKAPKELPKGCIQCKSKIVNIFTNEVFEATPEYFATNPLAYDVGESEDTPTIDKLFEDWVGSEGKKTLYQVLAYCLTQERFMQRIFALIGGGSNGKSTFIRLVSKILGLDNITSSELRLLCERNFETAVLYRKLLCIVGEVSYEDLTSTGQLKRLSGEDKIRFEFKGKQPFSAENTAAIICLTNSLPKTPDRSLGFYRRWLIIEFSRQFPVGKDPLADIPEKEYQNLAKKCIRLLRELYETRKFHNEGTYEEREAVYEEKSNPILKFIEEKCIDSPGNHTKVKDFAERLNSWLKEKHQRPLSPIQISRMLKSNGWDVGSRKIKADNGEFESAQVVCNLEFTEVTELTGKNKVSSIHNKSIKKTPVSQVSQVNPPKLVTKVIDGIEMVGAA